MKARYGKTTSIILLSLSVILCRSVVLHAAGQEPEGLAWLADYHGQQEPISVVVFMDDETVGADLVLMNQKTDLSRASRIKNVIRNLKSFRSVGMDQVADYLARKSQTEVVRHWIVPAFTGTITVSEIQELQAIDGVLRIVPNLTMTAIEPVEVGTAPSLASGISGPLQIMGVPQAWARGVTGQGRLVASFDTGVDQPHPALAPKWRGNSSTLSASWFSTLTPDGIPQDKIGHGTHTMGVMVGSVDGDTIGVAPGAEWITAAVIDQGKSLSATISDIIQAYQWALNPDDDEATTDDVPDVILNSWGIPAGIFSPCDATFWGVIDNVEAAGIVTVFAAGNEGPNAQTLRNPADRPSGPLNSFSVGAVDNNKVVGAFSSRGPSACDGTQIKPEVVAPGVTIRSSTLGGGYTTMTGTSMAAPYVAGLVALARQYNPEATVEQIKTAIILSAEDLGAVGEDNAYGHGLPHASRMLDFLPIPSVAQFAVAGTAISDDGIAVPGERIDLQVILTNAAANMDLVSGQLELAGNDPVSLEQSLAEFYFGDGGSTAINSIPYQLLIDSDAIHGELASLNLLLSNSSGQPVDTVAFGLRIGYAAPGIIDEHASGRIDFTVSDFGQFGLAPGSIYNLNGTGFRFDGSENLLHESGVVIGRNSLQLSSAIRDENASLRPSDFTPTESLSSVRVSADQSLRCRARYVDTHSEIPIPVTVAQETIDFAAEADEDMVIFRYRIVNDDLVNLTDLHFGFLADFDLSQSGDGVVWDEARNLVYQTGEGAPIVGLIGLKNVAGFTAIENGATKTGYNNVELFDLISKDSPGVNSGLEGDIMLLAVSGAIQLAALDSMELAFAIIAGHDLDEFYQTAERAAQRYAVVTSVEEDLANLPTDYLLHQNYPNPFNPTTTVSLTLATDAEVSLDIFNLLGQKVRQLYAGQLDAGRHLFEWDARNDAGQSVASGLYLYRLRTGEYTQSRKMMLLK